MMMNSTPSLQLNVFGEYQMFLDQVVDQVEYEMNLIGKKDLFFINKQTIELRDCEHQMFNISGIYAIYHGEKLKYIGQSSGSENSLGARIYRFCKEAYDISRHDEGHPAGLLWAKEFGIGILQDCRIAFCPLVPDQYIYSIHQIEKQLIRRHRPQYNKKR